MNNLFMVKLIRMLPSAHSNMAGTQRALCGVCSREVAVTSAGLVRVHGPLSNRCSGSRQAAQRPSPQPQPSEQDVVSPLSPSDSLQPPDLSARPPDLADTIAVLGQPCQTLRRIPKGSRDAVAAKLSTILENVTSSNSIEAWERLLLFPRRCLYTPSRGGQRWSLASLVNKQVANEDPSLLSPNTNMSPGVRMAPRDPANYLQ